MKRIQGKINIEGIKRCYAEGAIIKINCKECNEELHQDFGDSYLMYPVIGEEKTFELYCEDCDIEYSLKGKVLSANIEIEYDEESITMHEY